jgi:hypothetical protein
VGNDRRNLGETVASVLGIFNTMVLIFLLQLVLPLVFIAWVALAPLKSNLGFFCQVAGTAIALFALALTGLWLSPPWWMPFVFAGLLVAAILVGWYKRYPFA